MRRHPTAQDLTSWMHGGPGDEIGEHIDDCPHCADVCAELVADAAPLPDAVAASLSADRALEERVMHGVESALLARTVGETFLGLIGLAVETTKTILGEEES